MSPKRTPAVVIADALQLAYGSDGRDENASSYDYWGTGADAAAEMLVEALADGTISPADLGMEPMGKWLSAENPDGTVRCYHSESDFCRLDHKVIQRWAIPS